MDIRARMLMLILILIVLSGCTNSTPPPSSDAPTESAVSDETATATLSVATAEPSPTFTTTATSTIEPFPTGSSQRFPTPVFGQGIWGLDSVFRGQSGICQLPCWHDLHVGTSTVEETAKVFADVLGFAALPNLQEDPYLREYHVASHSWDIGPDFFGISIWFNNVSRKLEGLRFMGVSEQFAFEPYTSPVHVLRELGEPTQMLMSRVSLSEKPTEGGASLKLIYKKGIVFHYSFQVFIENDGVNIGGKARICLGHLPGPFGYWAETYITEPINDLAALSPLQEDLFGNDLRNRNFQSFESLFGVTAAEVTEIAQQQSNPCFYTQVP